MQTSAVFNLPSRHVIYTRQTVTKEISLTTINLDDTWINENAPVFVIFLAVYIYTDTYLGYRYSAFPKQQHVQSRVNPWQRRNYTVFTTAKTQRRNYTNKTFCLKNKKDDRRYYRDFVLNHYSMT